MKSIEPSPAVKKKLLGDKAGESKAISDYSERLKQLKNGRKSIRHILGEERHHRKILSGMVK